MYSALRYLMGVPLNLDTDRNVKSRMRKTIRKEFLKAIRGVKSDEDMISDPENLPSFESAYAEFLRIFPRFAETLDVDEVRSEEYAHLQNRVCFDYSGFGLFSHLQRVVDPNSSTFRLSYVSASLPTHALYGAAGESSLEGYIRHRIMECFRISEADYSMVFTASKGSAVKLLAESYRFDLYGRLLTAYDHKSSSVEWMIESARHKGAKVSTGVFRLPSLRICSKDLKKQLLEPKKSRSSKGMFVFPLQSRVTGARYSYQWIPFAQQNHWHVLLDASALCPRDMDALGLSLFSPDFIVSSFYKVFGADPSGFGCLFIKKTTIKSLCNSSKARAVGMVRIFPPPSEESKPEPREEFKQFEHEMDPSNLSSFSGPLSLVDEGTSSMQSTYYKGGGDDGNPNQEGDKDSDKGKGEECGDKGEEDSDKGKGEECGEEDTRDNADRKGKGKMLEQFETGETSHIHERGNTAALQDMESSYRYEAAWEAVEGAYGNMEIQAQSNGARSSSGRAKKKIHTLKELLSMPLSSHSSVNASRNLTKDMPLCKALDQTKILRMSKMCNRLRYLVTWLVFSLLKLRHSSSSRLVQIYGPGKKYDRGASMAFNLYDWDGALLQPTLVQRLADRNSISLGLAEIKNVEHGTDTSTGRKSSSTVCDTKEFLAVTIGLSFINNFEDVYKVWVFVAKFLDADFVNKEIWKYQSLNQEIITLGI